MSFGLAVAVVVLAAGLHQLAFLAEIQVFEQHGRHRPSGSERTRLAPKPIGAPAADAL